MGRKPPTVLVADDDEGAGDALAACLEAHGCAVYVVRNGMEAVRIAKAKQPDFMIVDIDMPLLDGDGVARQIRAQSWTSRPQLIVHAGLVSIGDKRNAVRGGFDFRLSKPFNLFELRALVRDSGFAFDLVDTDV